MISQFGFSERWEMQLRFYLRLSHFPIIIVVEFSYVLLKPEIMLNYLDNVKGDESSMAPFI